jgi:hypothetical protein
MLLADALLDLGHQKEGSTVSRRLLNEKEAAEGGDARQEEGDGDREAARNAEAPTRGTALRSPGFPGRLRQDRPRA